LTVAQRLSPIVAPTIMLHVPAVLLRKAGAVTAEPTINRSRVQNFLGSAGQAGRQPNAVGYVEPLTGREEEVLQLLIQGVTTTHELAASLVVSDNTVKFHLRNILDKLHLHNRAQVVAHASRRQPLDRVDSLNFGNLEPLIRGR
jgi:DNA-binding NarL/FixJ family response regulator